MARQQLLEPRPVRQAVLQRQYHRICRKMGLQLPGQHFGQVTFDSNDHQLGVLAASGIRGEAELSRLKLLAVIVRVFQSQALLMYGIDDARCAQETYPVANLMELHAQIIANGTCPGDNDFLCRSAHRGMYRMKYWLFKSEPDAYSIEDLQREPRKIGRWDGIRNYQARNLLRDEVSKGDSLFFYHSNAKPSGIVGIAQVVKAAYPDPAQYNPESKYYDPRATPEQPRWFSVDVQFKQRFGRVISLAELKSLGMGRQSPLANMVLLKQGRLSIQPVSASEWKAILKLL